MSVDISKRLKMHTKRHDLLRSSSQPQIPNNNYENLEKIIKAVDDVATLLAAPQLDPKVSYDLTISQLHQHLKTYGEYVDAAFPDQLNHAFNIFRNSSQDTERLDLNSRVNLLELIELRAQKWKSDDYMRQYYKKKMMESSSNTLNDSMTSMALSNSPPVLSPGEVLKTSGKFKQPTRIPGKNYCKDEVVIRNSDSGKVMGIKGRRVHMIEELSETIISFQRVNPGAKERLVQITGANEESIIHARQLIEDTIKRNASPVREHGLIANSGMTGSSSSINSSASEESSFHSTRARPLHHSLSTNDANIGEYKFTVTVGNTVIKITGNNLEYVRTSKLVLDDYFTNELIKKSNTQFCSFDTIPKEAQDLLDPLWSPVSLPSPVNNDVEVANGEGMSDDEYNEPEPLRKPHSIVSIFPKQISEVSNKNKHTYSVECMARLSRSPLALTLSNNWDDIIENYPQIVRQQPAILNVEQHLNYKPPQEDLTEDNDIPKQ